MIEESQFEDAPKELCPDIDQYIEEIVHSNSNSIAMDEDGNLFLFKFVHDEGEKCHTIKKNEENRAYPEVFESEYTINLKVKPDFKTSVLIINKNLIVFTASTNSIGFFNLSQSDSNLPPHYLNLNNLLQENDFENGFNLSYAF